VTDQVADRRDQIHRVACRLFKEHGFHGSSVRDIAEAVGLQGGSLYAHVDSKDDLLWDIVDAAAKRFFDAIRPILDSSLGVMQKLRAAMIAHVEVTTRDSDAAIVYSTEWRHLSPERRAAFTAKRDEYEGLFRELVGEAIRERYLATHDARTATRIMLSALNGVSTWYRADGRLSPEEVGRLLADSLLDGLRRRTA
jgi:AcrR family transcriptional regulator